MGVPTPGITAERRVMSAASEGVAHLLGPVEGDVGHGV